MITVSLMGGLGNQLFMIFTIIAYGIENKVKFVLPRNKLDKTSHNGDLRPTYWDSFLKRLTPFLESKQNNYPVYRELQHHYKEIPKNINQDFKLFGYFQSYKYFENYKKQIFNIIGIENLQNKIKDKYKIYFKNNNNEICSIHFRIGDYKTIEHAHPILKLDYYKNSIKYMLENNNTINEILCFGQEKDELELLYNIEKLQLEFPQLSFNLCDFNIEDWEQMLLMSCCHHNIIANSSFSWWGAYFNDNPEKIVCYPKVWFGPKLENKKTKDMFPLNWKKIS